MGSSNQRPRNYKVETQYLSVQQYSEAVRELRDKMFAQMILLAQNHSTLNSLYKNNHVTQRLAKYIKRHKAKVTALLILLSNRRHETSENPEKSECIDKLKLVRSREFLEKLEDIRRRHEELEYIVRAVEHFKTLKYMTKEEVRVKTNEIKQLVYNLLTELRRDPCQKLSLTKKLCLMDNESVYVYDGANLNLESKIPHKINDFQAGRPQYLTTKENRLFICHSSTFEFDFTLGKTVEKDRMIDYQRKGYAFNELEDNYLIVVGGFKVTTCEVYDINTDCWFSLNKLKNQYTFNKVIQWKGEVVYTFGEKVEDGTMLLEKMEIGDMFDRSWVEISIKCQTPFRFTHLSGIFQRNENEFLLFELFETKWTKLSTFNAETESLKPIEDESNKESGYSNNLDLNHSGKFISFSHEHSLLIFDGEKCKRITNS